MLHLLIGTDWTENRRVVLSRLARDVKERKPGRILMVPELISHETERLLCAAACAAAPKSSARGKEVWGSSPARRRS